MRLNPLQEVGVMKPGKIRSIPVRVRLNPLQEVGVMKPKNRLCGTTRLGLNPLQEVGVMKHTHNDDIEYYQVLIPFRKSG